MSRQGDGTTSIVLLCGELLKQAERYLQEGLHPRTLADGFDLARDRALTFLDDFRVAHDSDREMLISVARTALRSKLRPEVRTAQHPQSCLRVWLRRLAVHA